MSFCPYPRRLAAAVAALLVAATAAAQTPPAATPPAPAPAPGTAPGLAPAAAAPTPPPARVDPEVRLGDWIAVVVNQELVTAGEIERRVSRLQADARREGTRLPDEEALRRQITDALVEERVIISTAREFGLRVDDIEVDRAVQNIAVQNQLTLPQLRERLMAEGMDYGRFRADLRDRIMLERMREREVYQRIQVSDEEIDKLIAQRRESAVAAADINLAQILVTVPEGADPQVLAARRARIEQAQARLKAGEDFATVARAMSEDANKEKGGELGMRPSSRLPDAFVEAARGLKVGEASTEPLRSGAGFHLLKVLQRAEGAGLSDNQTRARHILLRPSPQLSAELAARRLAEYRRQIEGGRNFEELAREVSEDGSAAAGGDLGWTTPGTMVPEFEEAMNALPLGGLSAPVVSRFGVHLIQVLERRSVPIELKQLREQSRNILREQKFEQAYADWAKELRSRAYVEVREPPV